MAPYDWANGDFVGDYVWLYSWGVDAILSNGYGI